MANGTAPQCPLLDPVTWHESFNSRATTISSIIAVVIQLIIIPFAVFLNGATIILIIKFDSLQKERFIVVGLLSLTDFLSGLIAQPLLVAKELSHLVNNEVNCTLDLAFYSSSTILWLVTLFQLTCLSYERSVAITDSFNYSMRISSRIFFQISAGYWAVSILSVSLYYAIQPIQLYLHFIMFIFVFSCCILFIYCNIRIILVLRRHRLDIAKQHNSVNSQQEEVKYLKERKTTITAAYIFGAFLLVNIPIIVDFLYIFFFAHGNEIRTPLYFLFHPWVDVSLHLNSILCPIIYGLRTKEFRKKFLRYFLGINHQVDVFVSYERRKDTTGPPKEGVGMAQSHSCDSPEEGPSPLMSKSENLCVEK